MKKILTIGYYADFSRFFNEIKKETLKKSTDYKFFHINLYFSGYIYSLTHGQKSIYLPFAALKYKFYADESDRRPIDKFIQYHITLNPGINEIKLQKQAVKYYSYFEGLLNDYMPDLIILSGDSRMPIEIIQFIAKKKSIKVLHFEQAPLGRTILDPNGVNANCSCREIASIDLNIINENDEIKSYKYPKWDGYKKYRVFDMLFERFLPFLEPIEHLRPKRNRVEDNLYNKVQSNKLFFNKSLGDTLYLLVLQVPDDVNMVYHSPYFKSHYEIVKAVHEALPKGSVLVVREHPLYKRLYESSLYLYIDECSGVYLDTSVNLLDIIYSADVVIVNNSTVGLESLAIGKPVVVLGNAYYDQFPLCYKYTGYNLKQLVIDASIKPTNDDLLARKKCLVYLFNNYFIEGHFRDLDGVAPKKIAKWICKNVH